MARLLSATLLWCATRTAIHVFYTPSHPRLPLVGSGVAKKVASYYKCHVIVTYMCCDGAKCDYESP